MIKMGADPNTPMTQYAEGIRHEITPLHLAAGKGYVEIVQALIKQGANLSPVGVSGCTPLDFAIDGD